MLRSLGFLLGGVMVLDGCADVGGGEDTNPFGEGTAAPITGTGEAASSASGDGSTTGGAGSSTSTPTSGSGDGMSSGEGPGESTSAPSDTSGGAGEGTLGECIGLGAWESCAQYCEAVTEVCVAAGCDGATVVYYDDVAACIAMRGSNDEATPCNESFAMGGGVSFARCCCQ